MGCAPSLLCMDPSRPAHDGRPPARPVADQEAMVGAARHLAVAKASEPRCPHLGLGQHRRRGSRLSESRKLAAAGLSDSACGAREHHVEMARCQCLAGAVAHGACAG